ncbi:hypothetical protein CJP74_06570 [Psittacicella melopsittaci]|uniref:BolA family transcriptional regulator n=1 Tax=Psittacicella melopsittaci TaxID=2028576 RepID=A0A3A1Y2Z5_9GAMM|nr:BolA family protein [Psittacicella melopsittaci]RIY31659.1 hypothetical protein CJP74_06570 [Psittacicella melopsittaci]
MFIHPHKIKIEQLLEAKFNPEHLEVIDESYMHHAGPEAGSHYKVIMVSSIFAEQKLIQRQREVNKVLKEVLANDIHALSLKLYSPEEWEKQPIIPESPKCAGKNKEL